MCAWQYILTHEYAYVDTYAYRAHVHTHTVHMCKPRVVSQARCVSCVPRTYEARQDVSRTYEARQDVSRTYEARQDVFRTYEVRQDVSRTYAMCRCLCACIGECIGECVWKHTTGPRMTAGLRARKFAQHGIIRHNA